MTTQAKTKWTIDPGHSLVQFRVKHLAIANVAGNFKTFYGDVVSQGDDFNGARVHFEIDTDSLGTNHTERDGHLKSPLFFDTAKFPKILFDGELNKKGEEYELDGALTIRDTQRSVKLQVAFTGTGVGRFNDTRAGFEVNGKINRKDFGLNFNLATDAGNLVVGEEVKLHFDIELIKQ